MSGKTLMQEALAKVVEGTSLPRETARQVMEYIMDGGATPSQIGAFLTALRMKGETVEEVAGFAMGMRNKAIRVAADQHGLLDTCGTGGDGLGTLNISTAAAIVAAAGGVRVAKHGNRAMSSKSGSADVLEALGVHIALDSEQAASCLRETGICFMFAQLYSPSMRHAAGPRKELGFRNVFNLLGPLTNPARADRQLLGVFDPAKTEFVGEVLRELGTKRALVVGSRDGMDEISVSAPTQVTELINGDLKTYEITPGELGLGTYPLEEIIGGDAKYNAEQIRKLLDGAEGAFRDIVLANAGACFYVSGLSETLQEGVEKAKHVIDSGAAMKKLEQLVQMTGALSHVS